MRILALDSSTAACSVAIWDSEHTERNVLAHRYEEMERGQSEALAPMVQDVLTDAGLAVRDMDFLAVTTGPGAFTGVRIGLAMARSLGLSSGVPVVGISTMLAVAHGLSIGERDGAWILIIMDTKREDVYAQVFDPALSPHNEPDVVMPEDLAATVRLIPENETVVIAGDAAGRIGPDIIERSPRQRFFISEKAVFPDATVIAETVARCGPEKFDASSLAPIYLRPPYAKVSPTGGKLRP